MSELEYLTQKEKLFKEWKKGRDGFSNDGIVDFNKYLKAKYKILFLLKETNSKTGDGIDLIKFIRNGANRTYTWDNIARWSKMILYNAPLEWKNYLDIKDEKQDVLSQIAVINIKKDSGTHTADNKKLRNVAKKDLGNIIRQIELTNPDLIISCGSVVFNFVNEYIADKEWSYTAKNGTKCTKVLGKININYLHPNCRAWDNILLFGLSSVFDEIEEEFELKKSVF